MAFQIAELFATIRADDAQIQRALPGIRAKLERVGKSMQRVSYIARRMFLAVAGVIALTVKQASDAEEAHNKFMTVFRSEGTAVSKWARDYGKAVGRAQVDMEKYLGTIQDTLVPLGIAREKATVLSKSIVTLGLDLASFNNEADSNALDNLQSALVGQSRAVLKYGVVINQAAVQQELLNMGIQRSYDLTTNQEKVQARLNIIFGSTTDAQGDLIRTQGSFENQLKALISAFKDMNAQIGQAFIPNAVKMMAAIRSAMPGIAAWVTKNQELTVTIAGITLAVLGLLAISPMLLATLGLIAAHPVVAALAAIAAALAAVIVYYRLADAAQRDFFQREAPSGDTVESLQKRIDLLKAFRLQSQELLRTGLQTDPVTGYAPGTGPGGWRKLRSEVIGYTKDIAALEGKIKALQAAETIAAKAAAEGARVRKEAMEEAAEAARKARDELYKKAPLNERPWLAEGEVESRLRGRAGTPKDGGAKRTGFVGIAQLGRQIQESILQKAANKERDRLLKEMAATAAKDLQVQKDIYTLLPKLQFGLGWIP